MTGGLRHLALAMVLFLASHSLTTRPGFRRRGEAVFGRAGFTAAYSILSLALLAWMIAALRAAPVIPLWEQAPWMRLVPLVAMVPASVLAVAGLTTPNPFSIGPGGRGFDPGRPGILRLTRHPVVWALALWAGAHLVANGTVAALMLFAPLLLLALAGPVLLDSKRRRALGEAEWRRLTGYPRAWRPALAETGWRRLAGGLALYAALLLLHPVVIGFSPLP